MRKNYVRLIVAVMLIPVFMTGCGSNGNVINDGANGIVSENADDSGYHVGEQESQNDTKPEQPEENKNSQNDIKPEQPEENNNSQSWSAADAEDIEKELAAYRAEREKQGFSKGGVDYAVAPNEENYKYGVGYCDNGPDFDSRELSEAYEAAVTYVEGTLKLESKVWWCVDPRMNAIYEDEDKGVANGYDADNIFLCEYNDNGKWQYLILVREKKGADWKVLYHGSSYKTDESDGGDKK